MKRLTKFVKGKYEKKTQSETDADILKRLGEYEDTGARPAHVRALLRENDSLKSKIGALQYKIDVLEKANELLRLNFGDGNGEEK